MARQYYETCNTTTISLATADWQTGTDGFYQKVTNDAIKVVDTPTVGIVYPIDDSSYVLTDADKKAIQKAASFIYLLVTGDGFAYVYASQKPDIDLTLQLKGVSG